MVRRFRLFALLSSLLAAGVIGACGEDDSHITQPETVTAEASSAAEVHQLVAAARRATVHLRRFENAAPAGWDMQVTGCIENPPEGGMGYHFGHLGNYLDGLADELQPEVLLYEPQPNGRLQLVGVEYIVPAFAWQGAGTPTIFGREMKWVEVFGEWQLHVWIWKHNPSGMFADWNPLVDCDHA